jgi:hypothetical protein
MAAATVKQRGGRMVFSTVRGSKWPTLNLFTHELRGNSVPFAVTNGQLRLLFVAFAAARS